MMMRKMILIILSICSISAYSQVDYTYYSKSKVEQDIDYAFEKLTRIHPAFLEKEAFVDYRTEYLEIKKSLKDSMSQNEVYLLLAPLFARLNDGHTGVLVPLDQRSQYSKAGGLAFPFFVNISEDSIKVSFYCANDSTLFYGGEQILEINGIKSTQVLADMEKLHGEKSKANKQKAIAYNFRYLLWILYGFDNDYELRIKDNQGVTKRIRVAGVTGDEFAKNIRRMPKTKGENYNLSINSGHKTARMKIKTFADLDGFCAFAKTAFARIKETGVGNLVIDIRNNGGGRSIVVDSLMNYITDKEYTQYKKIEIRISPDLKERYKEKYPNRYDWINTYDIDVLAVSERSLTQPKNNHLLFKGNVFLLTNKTSSSAAATFAGVFKELSLGTIVGEETGGTISYYGDYWFSKTPNMGINLYVSPKRFTQYGGSNYSRGVIPDYHVSDKGDRLMNYTDTLINKN